MPTNHQKTDQTYPLTPSWDRLEVPLDPLDPSTSPLTSLDPLAHLYCLANHQRTYQMSALTPWDPLDIPIDSWDPRSVPSLTPLLTLRPSQITNRLVGHLDFCRVSLGLARSYHTLHFISRTFLGQFGLFFLGVAELKNVK